MKKTYTIKASIIAMLLALLVFAIGQLALAAPSVEITANSTNHTVLMPLEKSFRFVAKIKNTGTEKVEVSATSEADVPKEWHLLIPTGRYQLEPGQSNNFVAVFEPGSGPAESDGKQGELPPSPDEVQDIEEATVTVPIVFSWEGGSKNFDVTVKTKQIKIRGEDSQANVYFRVLDKETNKPIKGASVTALTASGVEQITAVTDGNGYLLDAPSHDFLKENYEKYAIDQAVTGYLLQVGAKGYKSYFEVDFAPQKGDNNKTVKLEKLKKVGKYEKSKTIKSGYSIWWIRATEDEKYFAFSQGAHDSPDGQAPSSTKVLLVDGKKNSILWQKKTGGECWGLDISKSARYVAAGCHDGKIYLWDRSGKELWTYSNREGNRVRWLKFSPDEKYLLSGPVNDMPEEAGIFDVKTGKLKWKFYNGDYLREGRFSKSGKTVYLSSAHGMLHALNTSDGKLKWLGSGDHVIPFLLGIDEKNKQAIVTGKGRAFTSIDLSNGKTKWQTVVDQTITAAQMADDGSVVAATVGGMAYKVTPKGKIDWARQYGGVGHNAVHYATNSKYAFFGGPNPTLFDGKGNILWQREPGKQFKMEGPNAVNTGGANDVWMSEDAKTLVVGQDDGDIVFYKGSVKNGANKLSQLTGGPEDKSGQEGPLPPGVDEAMPGNFLRSLLTPFSIFLVIGLFFAALIGYVAYKFISKR